ncbi:hypothetical protein HKBW3S42_00708, partial [Candidatus Hakubella thermalkaliphila]
FLKVPYLSVFDNVFYALPIIPWYTSIGLFSFEQIGLSLSEIDVD